MENRHNKRNSTPHFASLDSFSCCSKQQLMIPCWKARIRAKCPSPAPKSTTYFVSHLFAVAAVNSAILSISWHFLSFTCLYKWFFFGSDFLTERTFRDALNLWTHFLRDRRDRGSTVKHPESLSSKLRQLRRYKLQHQVYFHEFSVGDQIIKKLH